MQFNHAQGCDFEAIRDFYNELIDQMEGSTYHPRWQKGLYPDDDYLKAAVEQGQMYFVTLDGKIVGAMILNHHFSEGCENVKWPTDAQDSEAMVIHTLGVMPSHSRRGIGRFMVDQAIDIALQTGHKAMRLDVLCGNLPAEKLYKGAGFRFVERVLLYYVDTGWCEFDLYELPLTR